MKTVLFVANVDWYVISHRLEIIAGAIKNKYRVIVACEDTGRKNELEQVGAQFINLRFSRSGINPINEAITILRFFSLYKSIKPDLVHHVSLKPVIYGSLVSKLTKTNSVLNAVSGLGYIFTERESGLTKRIMSSLMKFGFKRQNLALIFQNKEDFRELKDMGVIAPNNEVHFIKGSGVNLQKYKPGEHPNGDRIKILFPSRMLWDKGVRELREASTLLKNKYYNKMTLILAGMTDGDNKAAVPPSYLKSWEDGKFVKWIGHTKKILHAYKEAHIVVLPSYREGLPKSLIEASAMGKPIVTTDAVGCRDCVEEGVNGFKVPVKSSKSLAEALSKLIDNEDLRINMGKKSRIKAEKEFNLKDVVKKHMLIYDSLIHR